MLVVRNVFVATFRACSLVGMTGVGFGWLGLGIWMGMGAWKLSLLQRRVIGRDLVRFCVLMLVVGSCGSLFRGERCELVASSSILRILRLRFLLGLLMRMGSGCWSCRVIIGCTAPTKLL